MIEYREIEGAPGRYFDCPFNMGLLSDKACAHSHNLSLLPASIEIGRRFHCRTCQIGKMHAGDAGTSGFYGRVICTRCCRGSSRLVSGLCISCYNRQREVFVNKNARGKEPKLHAPIFDANLLVKIGTNVSVKQFKNITSIREAVLRHLQKNKEPVRFGLGVGWGEKSKKVSMIQNCTIRNLRKTLVISN